MERINPEALNSIFIKSIDFAFSEIERKYENPSDPENYLHYHDRNHSQAVMRRVSRVLAVIKDEDPALLSENDERVAKFAAGFHDIVQNSRNVNGVRKRLSPQNEVESARIAASVALKAGIFVSSGIEKVKEAILVTIPSFSPEAKTVFQPKLSKDLSLPALAVALADINGSGIDGPDVFIREGNMLFLEDNMEIMAKLLKSEKIEGADLVKWKKKILDWSSLQNNFVKGRKILFEKEVGMFPPSVQGRIRNLFNKFDASEKASRENLEKRLEMSIWELLKDVGYGELIR